jgi:transcriptional regulator with XRE-family HTH domain
MDLGTTIARLRKSRKVTQADLADRCDVTQAYLSQIENNRKEPNLATLKRIASALFVPLPIVFFMALNSEDIPPGKELAYDILKPSMEGMIAKVFLHGELANNQ